ncbi:hypothetical protein [Streptomyces smyrnaeus]|uniref:hypothetical protein n=1 Tax=Streptomyces smyrnaeus TaxID=1387713 RepID=UPI0033EE5B81
MHGQGGLDLRTAISLLPTPADRDWKSGESNLMDRNSRPLNEVVVNLLPTPRASGGSKGGPNQRGSKGDLMLPSAVSQLLPTPTASDGDRTSSTYSRGNPTLTGALTDPPSDAGSTSSGGEPRDQLTIWDA